MIVALALLLIASLGLWLYGETADVRPARILANVALLAGVGVAGAVAGSVDQWFTLNLQYGERLEAFRAAAEKRLEAGECDRVREELRLLNGQLTYESGLTFRVLEESTARLNAVQEASASDARGADAPPLAGAGEEE